jgi:hypothetical protein
VNSPKETIGRASLFDEEEVITQTRVEESPLWGRFLGHPG